MDIQKERAAFEESNNAKPDWSFEFDEDYQQYVAIDHEMQLTVDEINEHWDTFRAGWQASANREGYKLVPVSGDEKKEYLNLCKGGGYELSDFPICEDSIEVPEGADALFISKCNQMNFVKDGCFYRNGQWDSFKGESNGFKLYWLDRTLWQRNKIEPVPSADELNATAWESQIGGSHYKDYAIQPLEFALANNLDAAQHAVVKYVMRHKDKNGIEDLKKAKHYIDLMIEYYY